MDPDALDELTRLLQAPGVVAPADGLTVLVSSVSLAPGGDELVVRYSVPPLPDGIARPGTPRARDLASTVAEVAAELQGWATEHVRRLRPLPPLDRAQVARELPSREELWRSLRAEFTNVESTKGGFVGTDRFGTRLQVMLTPESWQDFVVSCEVGCRNDYGVDAAGVGDGPTVAMDELDETLATLDVDERFVVLDGRELEGSTRAELPPVRGTAASREAERIRRRGQGAWYAYRPDGARDRFSDENQPLP